MHKSKIKQISLAVCLALMPFSGFAAGLGKLNVSSGLGEPLKAEIELLSVSPEELSTLVAAIASEDAYAAQGIAHLAIHNNIKVEVAKAGDGSPILKLRSNQPVKDPYLDMLIQVDWASGRLQREYTVLLDPPGYKPATDNSSTMAVNSPTVNQPANTAAMSVDDSPPTSRKFKKPKKHTNAIAAPAVAKTASVQASTDNVEAAGDQTLTTRHGDTLSSIAKEMQVEGVSLDQMLAGLYENNKDAFVSGNMNRLKVGQIIKVPTKESLIAIDAKQASQSVKVHSSNWQAYRNALAGTVATSPAMESNEQKQTSSGKVETAEDKAALAKAGPQDVVKLSAGERDAGKLNGGSNKASAAKIDALQEEATARGKALKEAQERTAALETQIEDMKKLLALKSQSMATVQQNAETAAKLPDAKAEVNSASKLEEKTAEKPAPTNVAAAPEVVKSNEVVAGDVAAVDTGAADKTATPVVPPVVNTPVAVKKPAPPPPVPEPSFWQELMNSVDSTILGGVGAVALLGGGWMFLRNKRRKDLDSFERGILTSGGLRANTVFGNTTGNASNSDSSFLTDFAQSADGNMIDTNDVDPIAEAEVYMAYGRDAQAEEILKDAISKEPKRYELHLKLLEMYAARKDTSAFEAIAGELYTTLGANDPVWAKVAEIGHNMEPENPLYDVTQAGVASSLAMQDLGISDAAKAPINDLDFSLDHDANSVLTQDFSDIKSDVKKDEHEALFDLGSIKDTHLDDSAPLNSLAADNNTIDFSSEKDSSIDFDLGEFNMDAELADSHLALDKTVADSVATDNHFIAPVLDLSSLNSHDVDKAADSNMLDFDMDFSAFTEPKLDTLPDGLTQAAVAAHLVHDADMHDTGMANDIVFDFDLPSEPHTDAQIPEKSPEISFDLPTLDAVEDEHHQLDSSPVIAHSNEFEVNTFDLSTISLDLADAVAEAPATQVNVAGIESPDIDIKLDLVAAYIDMDDKEGARELLDEVMKEGGAKQQLRAQQMLASLA